jgi:hypothetical protein
MGLRFKKMRYWIRFDEHKSGDWYVRGGENRARRL